MSAIATLLDLVLPRRCVGCRSALGPLCPACTPSGAGPARADAIAFGGYDGALRAALLAYKERGRRDLARPLGALLAGSVTSVLSGEAVAAGRAPPAGVVLVPVPSARSVAAARGGDHVLRLGRIAAVETGLRLAPGVLTLTRTVRDSAGLRSGERATNIHEAMVARPPLPGRVAILIDDIVTTGATLREARRALIAAAWPVVGAAVVAATERHFPDPSTRQSRRPP